MSAAREQRPAGGTRQWLRVSRGIDRGRLLFAVVVAWGAVPDNCTALGRMVGVTRETIRADRDELLSHGRLAQRDGQLVAGPSAAQLLLAEDERLVGDRHYAGHALLPLEWFVEPTAKKATTCSRPGDGNQAEATAKKATTSRPHMTMGELLAAAELFLDALPVRSARRGIRSDGERATAAGVDRRVVRSARWKLERAGLLLTVAELRVGRVLLRARLASPQPVDEVPVRDAPLPKNRPAKKPPTPTAKKPPTPIMGSPVPGPIGSVPASRNGDGCPNLGDHDGSPVDRDRAGDVGRVVRRAARRRDVATTRGAAARANAAAAAAVRVFALASDPAAQDRLLAGEHEDSMRELLRLCGAHDLEPDRQRQVARLLVDAGETPETLLGLVFDAQLARPSTSVGAIVAKRIERCLGGAALVDQCDRARRGWPRGRLREALLAEAPDHVLLTLRATSLARTPSRSPRDPDRSRLIGAAGVGDWPRAHAAARALAGRGVALDYAALATEAGIPCELLRASIEAQATAPQQPRGVA